VKLTVELGRTKMTIKELLRLSQGSVVALDGPPHRWWRWIFQTTAVH
jgi:flagellar motor switch/type III secretory pathway protein FliN